MPRPIQNPWFFESVEAGIKQRIDLEIELAGGRRPVFVQLPTVKGVPPAPLGGLPVRRSHSLRSSLPRQMGGKN
jgi:hypothetical protein